MKFIPLSVPVLKGNELKYVTECIETEWVSTAGSYVEKFESDMSEYLESEKCVAVSNGTSALHLALILSKVSSGDEVIVPTMTFISPVNTVKYVGAEPVFMDCDDYLNIDTVKLRKFLEEKTQVSEGKCINKATGKVIKAIIPVHIFGHLADMEKIISLAGKYCLKVIEDATEALGSCFTKGKYSGKKAGTVGDFGCYSFNGNKIITTGGGGMLTGKDISLLDKAKYLSTQAKDDGIYYKHDEIGYNYRMTNVQAAIGVAQLENLNKYIEMKRKNFDLYYQELKDTEGLTLIAEPDYCFSNYWFYSLVVDKDGYGIGRDKLMKILSQNKIQARPVWIENHKQLPYLNNEAYNIENSSELYNKILNLPCSINLTEEDVIRVTKIIKSM